MQSYVVDVSMLYNSKSLWVPVTFFLKGHYDLGTVCGECGKFTII